MSYTTDNFAIRKVKNGSVHVGGITYYPEQDNDECWSHRYRIETLRIANIEIPSGNSGERWGDVLKTLFDSIRRDLK